MNAPMSTAETLIEPAGHAPVIISQGFATQSPPDHEYPVAIWGSKADGSG